MSIYILPQSLAFQEYRAVAALVARPLRAHIAGGHAQLVRFGQASEQADGLLGFYDNLLDTNYAWPNRLVPSVLDTSFTKLWAKNALLQYFTTQISGGHDITKLAGYNNRIHSGDLSFAENGDDFPRDDLFLDRDVRVGDIVKVRGVDEDAVVQTLWTSVKAIYGDTVDAIVDAATTDSNNPDTQGASSSVAKVSGVENGIVFTSDETDYDGLAAGYINETYDLLVIEGSVEGDDTVGRLRVISGSGTDDQASVQPAARGVPFAIGTRGLMVTISDDDLSSSSASASESGIPVDILVVGHKWRVTVHQAFTKPVPTSGGTYDGPSDTTYIVTVSRGGAYADSTKPQISVTTTNGIDISGPTNVTATNTAVSVGTHGATIKFTATKLRKGDIYYIVCTAATEGALRVLELNGNLAATLVSGTEFDLTLFILKPSIQISEDRAGFAPTVNWTQSDVDGITVSDGIIAYDTTWTDAGVPQALPLVSDGVLYTSIYVEYRVWLEDLTGDVFLLSDSANVDTAISGASDPDNPLKWAVIRALAESNSSEVAYSGVSDPTDTNQWTDLLSLLAERDDIYGLVPLTKDNAILSLYNTHVTERSSPELGTWRVAWFNLTGVPEIPIVSAGSTVLNHTAATTSDEGVCLCVIEDDPNVAGTQYTVLRCTSDNGKFLTNGVRAGDIVRTQYAGDGFGNFTYTEYVVSSISSEDELLLLVGSATPVGVAAKTEIWRNTSAAEEAAEVSAQASAWNNKRVRAVWPDQIEFDGVAEDGTFLCATLAAIVSGLLPHQSMSRVEVTSYSSVRRSVPKFTLAQLDTMTQGGVWVVTQDRVTGTIYTRQGVSTAPFNTIDEREEMIVRNVDSIGFRFREWLSPFIGAANVTPLVLSRIGTEVINVRSLLKTEAVTDLLGGQLIDAQIIDLRRHQTLLDHIILVIQLAVPVAVNAIDLTLSL